MSVEALNCPNCGAGVASDSALCEFCKTRLKTVACTSCLGLMFVGSQFCQHCGAIAAPVVELDEREGDCPRCRAALQAMKVGNTVLRGCWKCNGMWLDVASFEGICADRESQSAVLGFLDNRTIKPEFKTKVSYVPCPDCGQLMNRNNFARASGVIVDMCKQHGVWFDADELPAIIEFIRKGGIELSRQREKNELIDQRERLREERRRAAVFDQRFGTGDVVERDESDGIRSFVQSLFER